MGSPIVTTRLLRCVLSALREFVRLGLPAESLAGVQGSMPPLKSLEDCRARLFMLSIAITISVSDLIAISQNAHLVVQGFQAVQQKERAIFLPPDTNLA